MGPVDDHNSTWFTRLAWSKSSHHECPCTQSWPASTLITACEPLLWLLARRMAWKIERYASWRDTRMKKVCQATPSSSECQKLAICQDKIAKPETSDLGNSSGKPWECQGFSSPVTYGFQIIAAGAVFNNLSIAVNPEASSPGPTKRKLALSR